MLPWLHLPCADGSLISVSATGLAPELWALRSSGITGTHGCFTFTWSKRPYSTPLHMHISSHFNISEIKAYLYICGMAVWFSSSVVLFFLMVHLVKHGILKLMKSDSSLNPPTPHSFSSWVPHLSAQQDSAWTSPSPRAHNQPQGPSLV